MSSFNQKPRFASRPLEWLTSGGRASYAATDRFFHLLRDEFSTTEPRNLFNEDVAARLLLLRDDFRQVMEHPQSVGVLQRSLNDINPLIRAIAVWLLSKHANRFMLLGIEDSRFDYSPMVRKRVARALRKLQARELLQEMADEYPDDETVQWFAIWKANPKTYQQRLENFVSTVDQTNAEPTYRPSRMPLWFRDEYWSGSPPKSIEYMRTLLKRIQALVHG